MAYSPYNPYVVDWSMVGGADPYAAAAAPAPTTAPAPPFRGGGGGGYRAPRTGVTPAAPRLPAPAPGMAPAMTAARRGGGGGGRGGRNPVEGDPNYGRPGRNPHPGRGGHGGGGGRAEPTPTPAPPNMEEERRASPDMTYREHMARIGLNPGSGANVFDDWLTYDLPGELEARWRGSLLSDQNRDGGAVPIGTPGPPNDSAGANGRGGRGGRGGHRRRRNDGTDEPENPTGPGTGYTYEDWLRTQYNDPRQFREWFYSMDPSKRGEMSNRYVGSGRTIAY